MDHPRRRATASVAVLALVMAVVQFAFVIPARADTSPTDPSTTTPTTTGDTGSTSTTVPGDTTTTTTPGSPPATTSVGTPVVTIPPLVIGGQSSGPPLADPSPQIHQLLGEIEVLDADKVVASAQQALSAQLGLLDQALSGQAAAQQRVTAANEVLGRARHQLSQVATLAFMGGEGGVLSSMMHGGPDDGVISREMVHSTIEYHGLAVADANRKLTKARSGLAEATDQVDQANAAVDAARQTVAGAEAQLTSARRDLSAPRGWALSIEGDSAFTGPELAQWFTSQGRQSEATAPMDELAGYYVSEGQAEGVRGDMAFAQAVVETGGFTNPDTTQLNNFAGIGHCDSCASGFAFSSAQLGVRGQIQLLKSFAEKSPKYADPLVDPRLVGPSGCCPTWTQLTKTWASDPNYGPKILGIYQAMLVWLLAERATETGPPPALVVSASLVATSTTSSTTTTTTRR